MGEIDNDEVLISERIRELIDEYDSIGKYGDVNYRIYQRVIDDLKEALGEPPSPMRQLLHINFKIYGLEETLEIQKEKGIPIQSLSIIEKEIEALTKERDHLLGEWDSNY